MGEIDYVICAAGEGKRFSSLGVAVPKPQIRMLGRTFLEHSLSSLPLKEGDRVIVLTQKEHKSEDPQAYIKKLNDKVQSHWIELEGPTRGQLDTFARAKEACRGKGPIAIWNCDTFFYAPKLSELQEDENLDGVVPCGKMAGDHWSFFKTNPDQIVTEAVEKKRIGQWASVGYYFFRDQERIFKLAGEVLSKRPPEGFKEYYVSFLYTALISQKAKIKVCDVASFRPFGTPAEVEKFWGVDLASLKNENK